MSQSLEPSQGINSHDLHSRNEKLSFGKLVRYYLELIRFSHTVFALPFAALASIWAWVVPDSQNVRVPFDWKDALGILVCMVTARSFAMAVNRLVDARFDAANPRTARRHIPSGLLGTRQVFTFAIACGLLFWLATLLFLPNILPVLLAIPVLVFLAGYSFAKRFTSLVHYWLGIALMLAPVCAWIAIRGDLVMANPLDILPAFLLSAVVFCWVGGFDLIYACQDASVDKQLGLHSIPARLGIRGALYVAAFSHALMLVPLVWLIYTPSLQLGWTFGTAVVLIAVILIYEHSIVSANNLDRVNVAFFHANAVISLILLVAGVVDVLV